MTETADGIYGGTIFEHMQGATYRDPQQSYASMRDSAPAQRAAAGRGRRQPRSRRMLTTRVVTTGRCGWPTVTSPPYRPTRESPASRLMIAPTARATTPATLSSPPTFSAARSTACRAFAGSRRAGRGDGPRRRGTRERGGRHGRRGRIRSSPALTVIDRISGSPGNFLGSSGVRGACETTDG